MVIKKTKTEIGLITYGLGVFGLIIYLLSLWIVKGDSDYNAIIFLLSWAGVFIFGYIAITWKKITGEVFTPYIIFIFFFFLFNFGHPLMWSIGIHSPNEIGEVPLYPGFEVAKGIDIVKAQVLVLTSALMFHLGAVFSIISNRKGNLYLNYNKLHHLNGSETEDMATLRVMFYVSLIIGVIVIPTTLLAKYGDLQIARAFGYGALYYSDYARKSASVLTVSEILFFPCIIGLLIGSKFNKNVRFVVYTIFIAYVLLNVAAGNRGPWIYKSIILIWIMHKSYKPLNFKKVIVYLPISIIGLYFLNAVVSLRNVGITVESVIKALSFENSAITSAFFEMGNSMKPIIILQKYGWDIWPYTNTYVQAIGGMVTNKFLDLLNIPFADLSSFFSQEYLGISFGAGFSIIAEALLNFGPVFSPLFMIVLGYVISTFLYINRNISYKYRPLKYLFVAATLDTLIGINRNIIHVPLKEWFYGGLVYCIIIFIIKEIVIKKAPSNKINGNIPIEK